MNIYVLKQQLRYLWGSNLKDVPIAIPSYLSREMQ